MCPTLSLRSRRDEIPVPVDMDWSDDPDARRRDDYDGPLDESADGLQSSRTYPSLEPAMLARKPGASMCRSLQSG